MSATFTLDGKEVPFRDGQTIIQAEAVAITIVWSGVASFILYKLVDLIIGLRVTKENEQQGLDLTSHGESAYHT